MVVFYRLSPTAEKVRDVTDGHPIKVYKLTVSIISKLADNMRHMDRQHYYLAIKNEDSSGLHSAD
jgi:hypothetical protein